VQAPVKVASATPQAAAPQPVPERKPLDLNALRPVVASAAGASGTTTPASGPSIRWQKGPDPVPQNTQAYAALPIDVAPAPAQRSSLPGKVEAKSEDRVPASPQPVKAAAKTEPAKVEEAKRVERPAVTGWVIQLGATDDEDKAKAMLDAARTRSGKLLAKASPFTEKVTKDGSTLYRARFSGFDESTEAERACKSLKKSGFACFASRG
jgi:D-alanyl-D-alanine carboxypeptidase